MDAQTLARLARVDPVLLRPIRHRSEQAQMDLMVIRARAALVVARTSLVNTVRGLAKSVGERLPKVDAEALDEEDAKALPDELREVLKPILQSIEQLTVKIKAADKELEQIARNRYPETKLLMQISGVGTLIALTFVLTVEDNARFRKSRDVGSRLPPSLAARAAPPDARGHGRATPAHEESGRSRRARALRKSGSGCAPNPARNIGDAVVSTRHPVAAAEPFVEDTEQLR